MSHFSCPYCLAVCYDSDYGYVTGCLHFPPDERAVRRFQNEGGVFPIQDKMFDADYSEIDEDYVDSHDDEYDEPEYEDTDLEPDDPDDYDEFDPY